MKNSLLKALITNKLCNKYVYATSFISAFPKSKWRTLFFFNDILLLNMSLKKNNVFKGC